MSPTVGTVTVVIPCFNYGRFVADAARSALTQQGIDPEAVRIVIVDDGSTDGQTPAACDACLDLPGAKGRLEVIHQANLGLSGARNTGARSGAAGGGGGKDRGGGGDSEFLLFLDADDFLEPTCIADLMAAIRAEETAGTADDISHAYGQQRLSEMGSGVWRVPEWDPLLLCLTNLHAPTALVRRDRFEAAGGYTLQMRDGYEDWDFWLKFAERGWRGVRVRKPVYVWRRHSDQTMIHRAIKIHGELFARIVELHRPYYERHAVALVALANAMLHRSDATWIDESLEPIILRDLRAWTADLVRERDEARAQLELAHAEYAELERKPVVRFSKAVHGFLDRLPAPLAAPARGLLRTVKKAAPPARG